MYGKVTQFIQAYFNRRQLPIFFLGFSAGLPFALTASVLTTWLADIGITKSSIGLFTLVALPYSFKYLWSPFVDGLNIPILKHLGRRRSWLFLTQTCLVIAILSLGSINPLEHIELCAILAIFVTFTSATQDIVIDAYRIEYLPVHEQGIGATVYSYGYRIALYIAGALPLIISSFYSWKLAYFITGSLAFVGLITTFLIKEPHANIKTTKYDSCVSFFNEIILAPFKNFIRIPQWYYIIAFVVLFKLGDAMAGIMTIPFLLDIGFTKIEIVEIVKTYGLVTTFIGLTIGGFMTQKLTFKHSLLVAGIAQMISNLMFIYQNYVGHSQLALIATITFENLAAGLGMTVIIAYLSSLCSIKFAATQYALLSSIITLSRNLISGSSGFIVDNYNWNVFFLVSTLAALPALFLIPKLHVFDKHRE